MTRNHVSVHIDAAATLRYHCDQEDGRASLVVVDENLYGPIDVYLTGTPDEFTAFATLLYGEAERLRLMQAVER